MIYKISETCRLFLSENTVILKIRQPASYMVFAWFIIMIGLLVLFACLSHTQDLAGTLIMLMTSMLFILGACWMLGYRQESKMDLEDRIMIQKTQLFRWHIKTRIYSWPERSLFKYRVHYDSYEAVSAISLIVVPDPDAKDSVDMIRFQDPESFFKFQKLFNKKIHKHKIMEWYD